MPILLTGAIRATNINRKEIEMRAKKTKREEPKLTKSNYYSSWKIAAIASILVCYLLISQISFADEGKLDTALTRAEIEQLVAAPQSDQRQKGVESILDTVDFDTTWAFETIIKGIKIEQDYLEHSKEINSTYVWASWHNIQKYVRDLALLGSYSPASLKNFGENLPADQKTWVTIARGYQKDEMIHDKLRKIIAEKGNPLQKAMAVEAISQYKDTSDISILVDAEMALDNTIDWAGDSDLPGFNPVVLPCRNALREMGYILEWDSKEFKFVLKRLEEVENKYPRPE